MNLSYETIHGALAAQSLFEDKSWQLSPQPWALTEEQGAVLESVGPACLEFHQALETLYLKSAAGKKLLRNRPLTAPWVADYLDRGKPAALVAHARDARNRGAYPTVLRPDLLLTDTGFVMTELDSVPGGIGLTAFLNRLYGSAKIPVPGSQFPVPESAIIGSADAMIDNFYASLVALRPTIRNPVIALVVSDEASTYRPEMEWLAQQLQLKGRRVHCLHPRQVFPLGSGVCLDIEGNPERIDIIYRFFELFDLANIPTARFIFAAWEAGEVAVAPPMRLFQEEKLMFGLFHHHLLQDFWVETLAAGTLELLRQLIPHTWVIDPAPLPPGAVLDGPRAAGRPLNDWHDLAAATQKERDLIVKISGYHETAWGARSVILGSDCSRDEWQAALDRAIALAPANLHILQEYRKPRKVDHPVFERTGNQVPQPHIKPGRLRLCPYYFVIDGCAKLSGALATFCPPDKKIIHGMQDAALLPTGVFPLIAARG